MSYYPYARPCSWDMYDRQPPVYGQPGPGTAPMFTPGMMQPSPGIPAGQFMPTLPSGMPTGPTVAPMPVPDTGDITSQTVLSTEYTQGYLRTQIGKKVRVEFLIGTTGPLVDRTGTLLDVGASYILIQPENTDDVLLCDMYSIKFVTFLY